MRPQDSPRNHPAFLGRDGCEIERIAPGYFEPHMEAEHLARYFWASRWTRGRRVLDVACGTGYGSAFLLEKGAREVVGVEIHAPALQFAREHYPKPLYIQADAERLPLKAEHFDTVVSLETLEHLPSPSRFIAEVARVLKPKGKLVLSVPNRRRTSFLESNPYHLHEMTREELIDLLASRFEILMWAGQRWYFLRREGIFRLKGLGRLAYEISRKKGVYRENPLFRGFRWEPLTWCLVARKSR